MSLQLPAPAPHTSTWQAGHISFQLLQEPTSPHSGDVACSSCAGPPGRVSSPPHPKHTSEHCQILYTDPSAKEGLSPTSALPKRRNAWPGAMSPMDHPIFPKVTQGMLAAEKTLCRAETPTATYTKSSNVKTSACPAGNPRSQAPESLGLILETFWG